LPTTVAAALVLVLAIVPGAAGVYTFAIINGTDWRQKDWEAVVQHVGFSALGLLLYVLLARALDWPPASHVIPAAYQTIGADRLHLLLVPYLGHVAGGAAVGVVAAGMDRLSAKITRSTHHANSWNRFANKCVEGRWVVVTLTSGDVYAGIVRVADVGVPIAERDLILGEPALYDPGKGNYYVTPFSEVFLPAPLIQSIGALERDGDKRIGPPLGQPLFPKEISNAGPEAASTTTTAP
jgi:hypothetical protein